MITGVRTFRGYMLFAVVAMSLLHVPSSGHAEKIGNVGIHFNVAAPQGDFKENVDRNGYGGTLNGMLKFGLMPVKIGLELGMANYGSESREVPFSNTAPDVNVRVKNNNNIVTGHVVMRFQPPLGPVGLVYPYMDGLFGFNYLFTESRIEDLDNNEQIASSSNFDDLAMSYGVGGGVMFKVFSIPAAASIFLDLNVRYLVGGEAEYLKKGSIRRVDGTVKYDVEKSATDLTMYNVGLVFSF